MRSTEELKVLYITSRSVNQNKAFISLETNQL